MSTSVNVNDESAIDKQCLIDQINALSVDGVIDQKDVNYLINYLLANGEQTGTPRDLIQIRRGNRQYLPNLAQGEMGFTLDTEELFIGGLNGNVPIARKDYNMINVKDHGAKGDGATNDTAAFNKAMEIINEKGGKIFVPVGTYILDAPTIFTKNGSGILGEAVDSVRLVYQDSDGIKINAYYCSVDNISVLTNAADKIGLEVNSSYGQFTNIFFGGYVSNNDFWEISIKTKNMWNSVITKCNIVNGFDHSRYRGIGIELTSSVNNVISENHFEDCMYGLFCVPDNTLGFYNEGIVFNENLIIACEVGVSLNLGLWYDISNNIIDQMVIKGVYCNVSGASIISGNWINQFGEARTDYMGIDIQGGYDIAVTDNVITTNYSNVEVGIRVNSHFTSVIGNHILNFMTGILVLTDRNTISSNVMQNASLYAVNINGSSNQVQGNILHSGGLNIATNTSGNETQNDIYFTASVVTGNGTPSMTVDVGIPTGRFSTKAAAGIIQSADYFGQTKFNAVYMYDDPANTKTNARFLITSVTGNLPADPIRLSVMMSR